MNNTRRFLIIILGTANDIDRDLNFIADGEHGVNFVDGKGMFIGTFYSPYTTTEIHEKLAHRPAMMLFDITNGENYGINLPSKYYMGIFPEIQETLDKITPPVVNWEPMASQNTGLVSQVKEETRVEEYDDINDILEKLTRNKYDRSCLTEKEISILNKG